MHPYLQMGFCLLLVIAFLKRDAIKAWLRKPPAAAGKNDAEGLDLVASALRMVEVAYRTGADEVTKQKAIGALEVAAGATKAPSAT